jgi:hypothetical protein
MKVMLEAVYHSEDGDEPYIRMDMLSKNRRSILFRLWWLLRGWKRTELMLTVKKESGGWT